MIHFFALLSFWSFVSPINGYGAGPCYNLYGEAVNSGFLACPSYGGNVSMCCALARDIPPGMNMDDSQTRDLCLPNGLCQNDWANNSTPDRKVTTEYYWDFCTSENWSDGCLPDVCNITDDGFGQLTPCADTAETTKWCCGNKATDCCKVWPNHRLAVTLPLTLGQSTSTSTSTSRSSSPTSTTHSTTASAGAQFSSSSSPGGSLPSPTTTSAPSTGLSPGAQAGIGVGAALVGLAALVAVVFFVRRAMQRRRLQRSEVGPEAADSPVYDAKFAPVYYANSTPVEVEAGQARYELPAGGQELPVADRS